MATVLNNQPINGEMFRIRSTGAIIQLKPTNSAFRIKNATAGCAKNCECKLKSVEVYAEYGYN